MLITFHVPLAPEVPPPTVTLPLVWLPVRSLVTWMSVPNFIDGV
jgi:hypothetical protein